MSVLTTGSRFIGRRFGALQRDTCMSTHVEINRVNGRGTRESCAATPAHRQSRPRLQQQQPQPCVLVGLWRRTLTATAVGDAADGVRGATVERGSTAVELVRAELPWHRQLRQQSMLLKLPPTANEGETMRVCV